MHDCRKTQLQMTDWLFDDTPTNHLAVIGDCQNCYEHYHSLRHALHSFDQVAEAVMPEDNYWAGYEATLRAKLVQDVAPKRLSWLTWRLGWMVPAAVGFVVLVFMAWGQSRPSNPLPVADEQVEVAVTKPPGMRGAEAEQDTAKHTPRKRRSEKTQKPKEPVRPLEKKPYLLTDHNPILALAEPFENPANTQHFERAQRLLRAFRNAPAAPNATYDVAYERGRARQLLYENIVLRREAETRGDWPREEVLNDLEPLLLDIANLPKRPTSDDVTPIRERMQKQEIVAKLQLYATPIVVAALDE